MLMYRLAALDRSRYCKLPKQANKEQKRQAAISSKGQEPRTKMFNISRWPYWPWRSSSGFNCVQNCWQLYWLWVDGTVVCTTVVQLAKHNQEASYEYHYACYYASRRPEEVRHACMNHNKFSAFGLDIITWPQWHQCTELVVIRAHMSDLLC